MTDASTYKQRQPQYSMTARNELPGDGTRKPGPGAYRPEKVSKHFFSFRVKIIIIHIVRYLLTNELCPATHLVSDIQNTSERSLAPNLKNNNFCKLE